MTDAQQALEWAKERLDAKRYTTIGAAINGATPKYRSIEKVDGVYRAYHYADGSYVMTYIDAKRQEAWVP